MFIGVVCSELLIYVVKIIDLSLVLHTQYVLAQKDCTGTTEDLFENLAGVGDGEKGSDVAAGI